MKVEWGNVRLRLTVPCTNKTFNPEELFGLATSDASLSIEIKCFERLAWVFLQAGICILKSQQVFNNKITKHK